MRAILWAVLTILVILPLAAILAAAFSPSLLGESAGAKGFFSPSLWAATRNSLLLGVGVALIASTVSLALALALEYSPPPLARFWEALLFLPFLCAPYLLGLAWSVLAMPGGIFGRHLGLFAPLLGRFVFSLFGIAFITATHLVPLNYAMIRGYLAGTGRRFDLASRVHGLGPIRTFFQVTLPRLSLPLAGGALLAFLAAIEEFGVPAILGPYAGLTLLTTSIQTDLEVWPVDLADATHVALVLLALGIFAWSLYGRFDRALDLDYGPPAPAARKMGWAGIFVALWAILAGVLPILIMVILALLKAETAGIRADNFTLAHFGEVLRPGQRGFEALGTSAGLAFVGSFLSFGVACALALLQQGGRRGDRGLDLVTTALNALPGVVLAVALVLVWNAPWNPLPIYGHRAILLLAYMTVLLPMALRYAKTAAARVSPGFVTAARVHGLGWLSIGRYVVLPLMTPPLLGGFAVAFAFGLREFVTSVLLQPPGVNTVSTFIFNEALQGNEGAAMAMSVVSLVVSFAALFALRATQGSFHRMPLPDGASLEA
ncbi:MAG TPA: ABC transporter permease subunit [bacterium]|nr:ABC transporter permease subunit [bacterium]